MLWSHHMRQRSLLLLPATHTSFPSYAKCASTSVLSGEGDFFRTRALYEKVPLTHEPKVQNEAKIEVLLTACYNGSVNI